MRVLAVSIGGLGSTAAIYELGRVGTTTTEPTTTTTHLQLNDAVGMDGLKFRPYHLLLKYV